VITYRQLLDVFWKSHDPCAPSSSRQYMTAVFYANDAQKKLAEQTRDQEAAKKGRKIVTALLPLGAFYLAEDYHQKYYLRQTPDLFREFAAYYPAAKDYMNSTAVLRVNAYLDGMGTREQLEKEIDQYGLSPAGKAKLLAVFKARKGIR
jgi:peptide-methionine (S)-S-oxide reductase